MMIYGERLIDSVKMKPGVPCSIRDNEGKLTKTTLETAQCLLDALISSDTKDPGIKQEQVILKEFKLKTKEVK